MSAGGAGASRVSIPKNVKEMIKSIKEMVGNHSDEEIHAMLKECSMDPNETAQKLLFLDPFHEVKRRRDKRKEVKENTNNRDSPDSRWRQGSQGRGGRSGRGSFPSRYANDASDGRNMNAGKENGLQQGTERGVIPSSLVASKETESNTLFSLSSSSGEGNGLANVAHGRAPEGPRGSVNPLKKTLIDSDKLGSAHLLSPPSVANPPPSDVNIQDEQPTPSSDHLASPVSVLGVYSSASDPVLVPSLDSRIPGTVGTIKREVGSQRIVTDSNSLIVGENRSTDSLDINSNRQINKAVTLKVTKHDLSSSTNEKASTESGNSLMNGKMASKSQSFERNPILEPSHPLSSSTHGASNSRPSSNYGNRPQQVNGSQKVGPKEWKPKPTNPNSAPASAIVGTCEGGPVTVKAGTHSLPTLSASVSEESTLKLQEKLEELHLSHNQHVIIPNHLQVPEAERNGLSFGSFGANFEVKRSYNNDRDTEKSATPLSESSQDPEEITEDPFSSNQIESSPIREGDSSDLPQSPKNVPDNLSPVEPDVSSSAAHEYDQSKSETVSPLGGPQFSVVHTAPSYNIGLMPPILGTQFAPFDTSESQARDAARLPSFVVQQPFDPSGSYYPQIYRPSTDGDGRFPPFLAPGATNKYNGNIAVQSGQPQESGNSLGFSTAGPTPLATQAAGVMQSSLAVTQQPVPIFRQPSGVHLSHYPPNYIPYSQYFSPIYLPPQTIHHYLANPTFPQQPPTGSVYPAPGAAAPTGVKYSLSQYKPVANTGNSTHVGIPSGYAPYSSSQTGYSPSPAATTTTTNSTGNEDLSASQYKENNVYITGQQSESSAVWIPAPGRDISGLSASSFYSLSPQGQHVTFTPTQAGHGAFTGIYHPSQTMAATTVHPLLQQSQSHGGPVEMVGTPAGVFQQTRGQMNWTNNY